MITTQRIRTAFERNAKTLASRPMVGQKTYVTQVRVRDGLTCDIEEGPWKLTSDLTALCGGNDTGPNPGILGRAAFGSCLAICYVMWASKLGVDLSRVEIEVEADMDMRGMYGSDESPAGYGEVRYHVLIESSAPEREIRHVLDIAEAHSPYMDVFCRPQDVQRTVRIAKREE